MRKSEIPLWDSNVAGCILMPSLVFWINKSTKPAAFKSATALTVLIAQLTTMGHLPGNHRFLGALLGTELVLSTSNLFEVCTIVWDEKFAGPLGVRRTFLTGRTVVQSFSVGSSLRPFGAAVAEVEGTSSSMAVSPLRSGWWGAL